MSRFLLIFSFICLLPVAADARCKMPRDQPDASAGVIVFNNDHKVMQYCNGEKWIGLWGGGGGGLPNCANGEIAQFTAGEWQCNNGSGLTNLNASNLTAGTVPRARLGTGTANDTTFLRGDGTWAAPSGGGGTPCSPANVQTFNANGTWTKPSCGTMVKAECWGGGASGTRGSPSSGASWSLLGGGGGGYSVIYLPPSALPATVAVTRGAGGAARTGNNQSGANGGASSFGSYLVAEGGLGINGSAANGGLGSEHGGAGGSVATMSGTGGGNGGRGLFSGGGGGSIYFNLSADNYEEGSGGTSVYGGNGGRAGRNRVGVAGSVPGGGGGASTNNSNSGAGGDGRCIVTTY